MKIAIPARNNKIEPHFGQSEYYTVVEFADQNTFKSSELIRWEGKCKGELASFFIKNNVNTILVGKMGEGAYSKFTSQGIQVIRGCTGSIDENLQKFLNHELTDHKIPCDKNH